MLKNCLIFQALVNRNCITLKDPKARFSFLNLRPCSDTKKHSRCHGALFFGSTESPGAVMETQAQNGSWGASCYKWKHSFWLPGSWSPAEFPQCLNNHCIDVLHCHLKMSLITHPGKGPVCVAVFGLSVPNICQVWFVCCVKFFIFSCVIWLAVLSVIGNWIQKTPTVTTSFFIYPSISGVFASRILMVSHQVH